MNGRARRAMGFGTGIGKRVRTKKTVNAKGGIVVSSSSTRSGGAPMLDAG